MRVGFPSRILAIILLAAGTGTSVTAQAPDPFRWMDFHSQKDQSEITWVTRALDAEKWTAIREVGVQYDAALVVTTLRSSPESAANADQFAVWSVSLTNHGITPLLKGYNLRWLDMMMLAQGEPPELGMVYDSCAACSPEAYFTAFHFDMSQHIWAARWMRGGQGAPLWNPNPPPGVSWSQAYAGLAEPDGHALLGTWSRFDYGGAKPAEDYVYRYDLDPLNHLERTQLLSGKDADAMKARICHAGEEMPGLKRGQDTALCGYVATAPGGRAERKPVTTPPVNNHGHSTPPGSTAARH